MSQFNSLLDDLDSRDDFERALNELVKAAIANDIDVQGGCSVDADGIPEEYGIEIFPVIRESD